VEKGVTVYIIQEMRGRDITDATQFGDVEILLTSDKQTTFSTQPTIRKMGRKLEKFTDNDYLLLAGDPVAIALASAIASRHNNGRFKLLKWDRQQEKYYPLQADLNWKPGGL
jgi:hypothetical protein|tara:strand:- start:22723 stop:23058 length:336 start_codon:yes stop_codon:yes gene_type:complete